MLGAISAGPPIPDKFFGLHVANASPNGIFSQAQTPWPASLGAHATRFWDNYLTWRLLDPNGTRTYNWTRFDYCMTQAQNNNCDVIYTLGQTPDSLAYNTSASPQYNNSPPTSITDWQNYVTAVVSRYGTQIAGYEIWNEPEFGWSQQTGGTVAALISLASTARTIIKAANPNAIVFTPAFGGVDPTSLGHSVNMDSYLVAGGGAYADAVAFHAYPGDGPQPEQSLINVSAAKSIMANRGAGSLPLWDTESSQRGWYSSTGAQMNFPTAFGQLLPTSPIDLQSSYVTRHFLVTCLSGVNRSYFYTFDNPDNTGGTTSITAINMTSYPDSPSTILNPSNAFIYIKSVLGGGRIANFKSIWPLYTADFRTITGGVGRIYWCTNYQTATVTDSRANHATDNLGNVVSVAGGTVNANASPTFVWWTAHS